MGWNSADHPPEHVHDQLQRSEPGRSITPPPFELPDLERRFGWGWILLSLMLLMLISTSLAMYFDRNPYESALRTYLIQSRAEETISKQLQTPDMLKPHLEELAPKREKSVEAARYYFVMHYEVTGEFDRVSARTLSNSPYPRDQAMVEAYQSPSIDPKRAAHLAKLLGEESVVYQLAGHHAKQRAGLVKEALPRAKPNVALVAGVFILTILLVLLGGCLLLVYGVMKLTGQVPMMGSPVGHLRQPDGDRFAMRTFQIFVVYLGLSTAAATLLREQLPDEWLNFAVMIGLLLFTLVLLPQIAVGGKKLTLKRIGITTENLGMNVLWGVLGGIAALSLILLAPLMIWLFPNLPPPEHPVTIELEEAQTLLSLALLFFMGAVAAPIWEEICFRGLMLPAMATVFRSATMGVLVSSFCFAAIHPTGIPAWPTLAGVGALSCVLTYQTRSLVPSIVMHGVYNFTLLMMQSTVFG